MNTIKKQLSINVISSINKKINTKVKLQELLTTIMDIAKDLLHSEGSSLLLSDLETEDLIFNVVIGDKGDIIKGERIPKGKGIAGIVAETKEPVIVNDVQNDPRFFKGIDKKSKFVTRNILCLPMIVMGDFVGVLEVVNTIGRENFDTFDLKIAQYVADQAAIAIDSRRKHDDLERRIEELTALYEVSQSISFADITDKLIFQNILQTISKVINVRKASIFITNEENDAKLELVASYGLPEDIQSGHPLEVENSIAGLVFKSGDPMLVADIKNEMPSVWMKSNKNYITSSFISIPIIHENEPIGVLNMADKINEKYFDSFDLRVLTTISNQIADTYTRILNQKNKISQKRLEEEIDIAAEIQKKIIPEIPKQFKAHTLYAYNEPAKVVGGDFYDFYTFDENKYGIVIADVSGKGVPAAMFMGLSRNIIRAETRTNSNPATLLKNANNFICSDSEHGMFVTLFYALIDSHNNIITYSSGGHNNQLLYKRKTDEVEILNTVGKALGMTENCTFEERIILYEPGDILVLFTDGVIESLGGENLNIFIGEENLCNTIKEYKDAEPKDLINHLTEQYHNNSTIEEFKDDFTIFAVKF